MSSASTIETSVDAKLAEWGIPYSAEFVPFEFNHRKPHENMIPWKCRFGAAEFCYRHGIGHLDAAIESFVLASDRLPIRKHAVAAEYWWNAVASRGKIRGRLGFTKASMPIPQPKAASVLYCLVLDASVLDYATFEEWASECGYDTDSREAERTYRACLEQTLRLRGVFGDAHMAELCTMLQDY